jgi:predicted Zn-ribbon and HTH transcriptional regulator
MPKGKCHEVFEKVAKIHDNAHVLAKVWDDRHIGVERREESISRLYSMVDELHDNKGINNEDYKITFAFLDKLSQYNRGVIATFPNLIEEVDKVTSDLAINAILDCGCREAGFMIERDPVDSAGHCSQCGGALTKLPKDPGQTQNVYKCQSCGRVYWE